MRLEPDKRSKLDITEDNIKDGVDGASSVSSLIFPMLPVAGISFIFFLAFPPLGIITACGGLLSLLLFTARLRKDK